MTTAGVRFERGQAIRGGAERRVIQTWDKRTALGEVDAESLLRTGAARFRCCSWSVR